MRSWKTITACAAVAMSVAFYGCDRNDRARETTPPPASAPGDAAPAANRDLKVEDLIKDTNKYVGQEVTVVGEVDEVLSPMAFALDRMRHLPPASTTTCWCSTRNLASLRLSTMRG